MWKIYLSPIYSMIRTRHFPVPILQYFIRNWNEIAPYYCFHSKYELLGTHHTIKYWNWPQTDYLGLNTIIVLLCANDYHSYREYDDLLIR